MADNRCGDREMQHDSQSHATTGDFVARAIHKFLSHPHKHAGLVLLLPRDARRLLVELLTTRQVGKRKGASWLMNDPWDAPFPDDWRKIEGRHTGNCDYAAAKAALDKKGYVFFDEQCAYCRLRFASGEEECGYQSQFRGAHGLKVYALGYLATRYWRGSQFPVVDLSVPVPQKQRETHILTAEDLRHVIERPRYFEDFRLAEGLLGTMEAMSARDYYGGRQLVRRLEQMLDLRALLSSPRTPSLEPKSWRAERPYDVEEAANLPLSMSGLMEALAEALHADAEDGRIALGGADVAPSHEEGCSSDVACECPRLGQPWLYVEGLGLPRVNLDDLRRKPVFLIGGEGATGWSHLLVEAGFRVLSPAEFLAYYSPRSAERTRALLLLAAAHLKEQGKEYGPTVLAKEAGVNKGTASRHFSDVRAIVDSSKEPD